MDINPLYTEAVVLEICLHGSARKVWVCWVFMLLLMNDKLKVTRILYNFSKSAKSRLTFQRCLVLELIYLATLKQQLDRTTTFLKVDKTPIELEILNKTTVFPAIGLPVANC